MNGNVSTRDDEVIGVGARLPQLEAAAIIGQRLVRVVFDDGRERIVDLAPVLESRPFYRPLRSDDALFATMQISEFRDSLQWDGGLDVSADWLGRLPDTDFTNGDFRQAMTTLCQSNEGMALQLGISRRQVAYFAKDRPIPRHIALACRYLLLLQAGLA